MATAIPPPYFITADDKRGLIVVITAIVLAFVWTCSFIRTWMRWQARDCKVDDWLLVLATVSGHAPNVCILLLCLWTFLTLHNSLHTQSSRA
jgi:hypothetical protein